MNKSETLLALLLVTVLLCGVAWQNYRGAPKTAEVIIARQGGTPFDAAAQPVPTLSETAPVIPAAQPQPDAALAYLNRASKKEIEQLPGVGEVLAQRVLDFRATNGGFVRLEQLMEVSGIGAAKMEEIEAFLRQQALQPTPRPIPVFSPTVARRVPYEYPLFNRAQRNAKPSLNRVTMQQLQQVSGIGPQLAKAILLERQRLGGFKSWDEVDGVSNVGPSRLKALQDFFVLP
ncbi:MAG: helix-hairpin-helix domain-containing protein [Candidatus Hinthialibacter antarcticus]|nr:helix-hairpin-helix domain-containing protein [Candidatus Hinthialibacter antarcticus]